jgi:hypothetical protein
LIAWGLGITAGVGMQLGYGRNDDFAGILAALFSLGGILLAKWLIFINLVGPGQSFGNCFGVMDGVFILLAFFSAYKVGSGQAGD